MASTVEDFKRAILDTIEERGGKFLSDHADAREFIQDRATRLAGLGYDYTLSDSKDEQKTLLGDMEIVRQSMENELSSVALDAKPELKALFKEIAGTAFSVFIKALPALLAAL